MSAKADIQHGIVADVGASRDAVVAACQRAVAALGKHAEMSANATQATVAILPGMSQKLSHKSPIVNVNMSPAANNRVAVHAAVGPYRTLQTKYLGFIPMGPKRLVGRSFFFKFLDAFELELRALDPAGGVVQRRRPA